MKWLLLLGGAYLLLSKRQGMQQQPAAPQYPQAQQPTAPQGDVVDRVKGSVNDIIEDVRSWWDSVADQNLQTPQEPLPPTRGPMTTNTAAFS